VGSAPTRGPCSPLHPRAPGDALRIASEFNSYVPQIRTAETARTSWPIFRASSRIRCLVCWLILLLQALLAGCGADRGDPRRKLAMNVVDALAAQDWDRSALTAFLCEDTPKESVERAVVLDVYKHYGGIKSIGTIKLIPRASAPAMAMDTFIPSVFNRQFAPYPAMSQYLAFHAAYLQLQTGTRFDGGACVEGWGRDDIPVGPDQVRDFLAYRGIFDHG
jgi:hypothetical protein